MNGIPIELYDAGSNSVQWMGAIAPEGQVELRFQATIMSSGAVINVATIDDGAGLIFERVAAIWQRVFLPVVVKQ